MDLVGQAIVIMDSKLLTSTRDNRDNINLSQRGFHRSRTLLEVEEGHRIRSKTITTSRMPQDRTQICKAWSNHMEIAFRTLSSSNRPAREHSHMVRTCFRNQTLARREEHKRPQKFKRSQKMPTLSCRNKWELSKPNSLKTSLSTRRTFWSSLIVMKYTLN